MSGFFDDEPPARPRKTAPPPSGPPRRTRALIGTAVVLVAAFIAVSVFTGVWTNKLWFSALGYADVFTKVVLTKVALFVVFGALLGLVVGLNLYLAYRSRPKFRPSSAEQASLDRYRDVVGPLRGWLLVGVSVVLGLFAGASGQGQWRHYLLWRNSAPFDKTDPYFGKDIGFFVFDLPWWHYLVDFAMTAVIVGLVAAVIVHYLYGGIRLQAPRDRLSGAAQVQISVLLGLFVLFKAVDYWLDRFDLATDSGGLITGMTYTDDHAVLPSKNILMFIALICALLFFANIIRRTWLLPTVGLGLLVLSAILLGLVWPGIVQNFQVQPSEPDKEGPYIATNIKGTRAAYQIDHTEVTDYKGETSLSAEKLKADAQSIPGIRLLDPSLVSDTFEQLQQVRGYYSVPNVLDVDRYPINGVKRDLVLAPRELNVSGLPDDQKNWANLHTVYTHGYGMIAAYGNQRNAQNKPVKNDGKPQWAEKDIPPTGQLSDLTKGGYRPQIYFDERSPDYSIVGQPKGREDVEIDIPEGEGPGGAARRSTYAGKAGVGVGGLMHKLLYAVKFSEPNIVLSSRVNEASKILYDRNPRKRVQKVAPWLTVDNDPYPAVVDGQVKWILDAYTVTDRYPASEKHSLDTMTSDSLNPRSAYQTLPTDNINYMRNSVKAVVDAYDGTVTLYQWDTEDPILKAWSDTFPGVIKSRDSIPPDLLAHMRYPEDMFKVQRYLLAKYHVTEPQVFYSGTDKWQVPQDPTSASNLQPPYRLSVKTPSGGPEPVFSLTSVFTPNKRENLASFISVDADASREDYGQIRILRLPGTTQIPGPSQIANQFAADENIQQALLAFTRTSSKAIYGNLLTLPVGDGLLYVQPLYTLRESGQGTYPVLRFVLASFGDDVGYGQTLASALNDVLGVSGGDQAINGGTGTGTGGNGGKNGGGGNGGNQGGSGGSGGGGGSGNGGGSGGGGGTALPADVENLLQRAEKKFTQAQQALADQDLAAYAKAQDRARSLVAKALKLAQQEQGSASGG